MTEQLDPTVAERLAALSEEQRALLAVKLAQRADSGAPAKRHSGNASRLVAFVTLRDNQPVDASELREHLEDRLPPYMVPQGFKTLDKLPRTIAGKIDRDALAAMITTAARTATEPEQEPSPSSTGAMTDSQRILADIWCDVLGLSEVGTDENFIELGGDSLLSIRVLARANQQGLRISPEDFFAHPTVAAQAAVASTRPGPQAEQGLVTGDVRLTPIQHWFFERIDVDPQHWNQSFLCRLTQPLDLSTLERAVQALLAHHDALRTEFGEGSPPAQRIREPNASVPVSELDLQEVANEEIEARITAHASALNASLDLREGPLLRVALVRTRRHLPDRLLLLAHHLIVDAVSWDLLVEDLERACNQAGHAAGISLGAKTTSFKAWAERLAEYAQSDGVRAELEHWRAATEEDFRLPVDNDAPAGACRFSSRHTVTSSLDPQETEGVLREVPGAFNSVINEILLTALAVAIRRWSGTPRIRLDLEGHGRDAPFDDLDVSRTVGWFTTVYPVVLSVPPSDDPVAVLTQVKEQLRSIPMQGLGYGLLRELAEDQAVRSALRAPVRSELLFNYVGRMDLDGDPGRRLALENDVCGVPRSPRGPLPYRLEINARVSNSHLEFQFGYSDAVHLERTIATLADDFTAALRALLDAARGGDSNSHTPSDFPLANFDQSDLDGLAHALDAIDADDPNGERR